MKRAIIIVLDSVGIGSLPDAEEYGDEGANTLSNVALNTPGFNIPNLKKMGIHLIEGVKLTDNNGAATDNNSKATDNNGTATDNNNTAEESFIPAADEIEGSYGRAAELSPGKDTITGHWEITGNILNRAFPTFPEGFPKEVIDPFKKAIETDIIGNIVASGTEIINKYGDEHVQTGYPIIYTSADSVFQIAAHEDVIPREKLYYICNTARLLLTGDYMVARVIARPFIGSDGNYTRTPGRKDFAVSPPKKTLLDFATESGIKVLGIGKIGDIFNGSGISKNINAKTNAEGIKAIIDSISDCDADVFGIIFANLVDFDMLYGHRNNIAGYASSLEEFDMGLSNIAAGLKNEDILIVTADHGCDPTYPGTDHTREYVPILVRGNKIKRGIPIGTRESFADIGATVSEYLGINCHGGRGISGESFLKEILR